MTNKYQIQKYQVLYRQIPNVLNLEIYGLEFI